MRAWVCLYPQFFFLEKNCYHVHNSPVETKSYQYTPSYDWVINCYVYIYIYIFYRLRDFFWKTFFSEIFFINIISALFGIGFSQKIILILQSYFFCGYSKWRQIKQSTPGLNRGLSWFFGGREVQTMWNLQKNVWCVQKSMFLAKYLHKLVWLTKHRLTTTSLKRQSIERIYTDSLVK